MRNILEVDLDLIKKMGISPTQFAVCNMIKYSNLEGLKGLNFSLTEVFTLVDKGFLTIEHADITDSAESLIRYAFVTEKYVEYLIPPEIFSDVLSWIEDWREYWPKSIRSNGILVRGDLNFCKERMSELIAKHPEYVKEKIYKATIGYLNRKMDEAWKYTMVAHNFIQKGNKSVLAQEIEALETNDDTNTEQPSASGEDWL